MEKRWFKIEFVSHLPFNPLPDIRSASEKLIDWLNKCQLQPSEFKIILSNIKRDLIVVAYFAEKKLLP